VEAASLHRSRFPGRLLPCALPPAERRGQNRLQDCTRDKAACPQKPPAGCPALRSGCQRHGGETRTLRPIAPIDRLRCVEIRLSDVCGLLPPDLEPVSLAFVRASHKRRKKEDKAFSRDPEGQTIIGIPLFLLSLIETYTTAAASGIDSISLLLINDSLYKGPATTRHSNLATLLIVGLLAESGRELLFLVPDAGVEDPIQDGLEAMASSPSTAASAMEPFRL
jgi:hypothetical protein